MQEEIPHEKNSSWDICKDADFISSAVPEWLWSTSKIQIGSKFFNEFFFFHPRYSAAGFGFVHRYISSS